MNPNVRLGRVLDRRGLRWLLARTLTIRRSQQFGRPTEVWHEAGTWRFAIDGRILAPNAHGWVDPAKRWDTQADDVFFWNYRPKQGDVIVDIGAGIGTELFAYADRIGGTGSVYLVEAHPRTFEKLQALIELNSDRSVRCHVDAECVAIDDHVGMTRISDIQHDVANRLVSAGGIGVPVTTLDLYTASKGIERIDFLKMNIEGAERGALAASEKTLSVTANGAIGCHDFLAEESGDPRYRTKSLVKGILLDAGFTIFERPDAQDAWTRDYVYFTRRVN